MPACQIKSIIRDRDPQSYGAIPVSTRRFQWGHFVPIVFLCPFTVLYCTLLYCTVLYCTVCCWGYYKNWAGGLLQKALTSFQGGPSLRWTLDDFFVRALLALNSTLKSLFWYSTTKWHCTCHVLGNQ